MSGEAITLWTIRASLVFAFLAALLANWKGTKRDLVPRQTINMSLIFWTTACLLFLLHVGAAFHFYHDWQHSAAFTHTAERTKALLGWRYGGGIYFNYLFGLAWLVDVVFLWRITATHATPPRFVRTLRLVWLAFFVFMVINGAVIFASGPVRWMSVVGLLLLSASWLTTRRNASG